MPGAGGGGWFRSWGQWNRHLWPGRRVSECHGPGQAGLVVRPAGRGSWDAHVQGSCEAGGDVFFLVLFSNWLNVVH